MIIAKVADYASKNAQLKPLEWKKTSNMNTKNKNNKKMLEGSRAIALTIKNIGPDVISAFPITPQTHIVEDLAQIKADGRDNFEYLRAESEFAAASIILGASAAGSRVYSATSSQGLLLMAEVIHNIAGMRLPVVMTCANRAISAPISIWNDHSDVMNIKDAGFIQFFASNVQEAINQHILAYKIAEKMNIPVMVNMDGYILTHSYEAVIIPDTKAIAKFLPAFKPAKGTYLDPKNPKTFGAFFPPAYYMETRLAMHEDMIKSLAWIKKEYALLNKILSFKNKDNGLVEYSGPKSPKTVIVALGSICGTIAETLKSPAYNKSVGLLKIKTYRPFPREEVRKIIARAYNVAVCDRSISFGQAGPVYNDVCESAKGLKINIKNYIVGLGGRDVTIKLIEKMIKDAPKKNKNLQFYA